MHKQAWCGSWTGNCNLLHYRDSFLVLISNTGEFRHQFKDFSSRERQPDLDACRENLEGSDFKLKVLKNYDAEVALTLTRGSEGHGQQDVLTGIT